MRRAIALLWFAVASSTLWAAPHLSFFCELPAAEFKALLDHPDVLAQLKEMQASVRVGLHDFSPLRAETIQKLNREGIPVAAWLLLPEADGYWFNLNNGNKAAARYAEFQHWTSDNHLVWEAVGIDLEPDIHDLQMMKGHTAKLAWRMYQRLYPDEAFASGQKEYAAVLSAMHGDGYTVESYVLPVVLDDRAAKTTSIQKAVGVLDLRTDREVPMLYSSFNSPAAIVVYHEAGKPIAIGSTGGGVVIGGEEARSLTWDEFSRDLLLASSLTDEIYIFSLEGCVAKGWLPRITHFDFTQTPPDLGAAVGEQKKLRREIQFAAVLLEHPLLLTVAMVAIPVGVTWVMVRLVWRKRFSDLK